VDRRTFRKLYDHCAKKLYNYALWIVRDTQVCDDIIQAAFIKAWNDPKAPAASRETEAWLFMVVRNLCMDHFRRGSRFTRFKTAYAREKSAYAENSAESRMLWDMLERLSEQERTIVYLHLRSGYSYREIAELVDSTEAAVRVKAFRAVGKLREAFAGELS
jgi:RNA polymerase sigma-70 factor (ECF subfamily)